MVLIKVRSTCQEGVDLVKSHEGFVDHVYICPAGKPTIGYGHYLQTPSDRAKYHVVWDSTNTRWVTDPSIIITKEEGEELLRKDLIVAELAVQKYLDIPLSDFQHGALVSFTFNLGAGALQRSTLRSKLNRGEYFEAADEFLKWVYAGGRKLVGLVRRRAEERELFLAGTNLSGNGEDNGAD